MALLHDKIYAGQYEDEKIINKYLLKDPDTTKGIYVDIGAGDPFEISNTYYYYWRGWNGLLVEPHPRYTEKIKVLRPRDILEIIAISDYDGTLEMCDSATAGSIIGDDYKQKFPNACYQTKCMTLNTLFDKYPQFLNIDILSIDVETNEEKVLSKCNFEKIKPQIVIIEYTMRAIDYRNKWEHYLFPYYNFMEKTDGNAIYVRKKEIK